MADVSIKCELYWAFHHKPNPKAQNKYTIDLANLSDAQVQQLQKMGLKVRTKDTQPQKGRFITVKSTKPFNLFDEDGTELPAETVVGNGTKATVKVYAWKWDNEYGAGISPGIASNNLVLNELKEPVDMNAAEDIVL